MYYDALHAAFPNITLIASTQFVPVPNGTVSDYHLYGTPDQLVSDYNYFDQNSSTSSTMIGEFAAVDHNSPAGADVDAPTVPAPFWQGTVSEAIFLIGAERNAGKIFGAAYAPSMGNWNSQQWLTNLLYFDADPKSTVLSTSYHMMALFSGTRFTTTRPVTTTTKTAPLYWVAGTDEATGAGIAKLAAYNSTGNVPVRLNFDGVGKTANLTVLTAPSWDSVNTVEGDVVVSTTTMIQADSTGAFAFSLPNLSIAVLVTEGGGSSVNGTGAVRGMGQKGKIVWETADGKLYSSS
jgi:alpha-N-arabinofuranosidase